MIRVPYKWAALGLLWVTYFLLQGTRQIYGVTIPQIKADIGASDLEMGMVASAFFMAYASWCRSEGSSPTCSGGNG